MMNVTTKAPATIESAAKMPHSKTSPAPVEDEEEFRITACLMAIPNGDADPVKVNGR